MKYSPFMQPPEFLLKIFRRFCDPAIVEDIEGDLREVFEREASRSFTLAKFRLTARILGLFRPGIIRKINFPLSIHNPSPMFKNYFITSVRSLRRSAGFSTINIVGLAVGLATFSLIAFYVYSELSFDQYHAKHERIFRIVENLKTENEMLYQATSSPPMGPYFKKDFPEVENYVRFQEWSLLATRNGISGYERESLLADSSVFDIFSFNLLSGDKKTALREPFSIVLTKSMAERYFGNEDPLGQTIKMDYDNYLVTGVMEDVPENSHFRFSNLISFSTWSRNNKGAEESEWYWNGFHTYILLRDAESVTSVKSKMRDFLDRNIKKGGMNYEDLPLQPLASIYMAEPRSWENGKRGNINNMYILSIIAVFILIIACFNYINLATARASRRLKEAGLRKTLGASRRMLIAQFLGESLLTAFVSALLAIILVWFALPSFRTFVESPLSFSILPEAWKVIGASLILVLSIGVLAGGYPAYIISKFQPVQVFRPSPKGVFGHNALRKILVSTQFMISIMLVAGTLLVFDQLDAVRNQDLGFNKEGVLNVPTNGDTAVVNHLEALKNELKQVPGVISISGVSSTPGQSVGNNYTEIEMTDGKMSPTNINFIYSDYDFLSTYQIELLAGRDFSREVKGDDTTAYLINETAVKDFGWTNEQALGKRVKGWGEGKIIGVIKDFNYKSLHTKVEPLMIGMTQWVSRMSVRIEGENLQASIGKVQQKWSELIPHLPFDYSFLDEEFDRQYKADQQLGNVAGMFTGLAIFIGCLGLLGLTAFVVERRTKEIGIRKVLGASVSSVVVLITREFVWTILVALVVATPATWYLISRWEQNFILQAAINPLQFLVAGLVVFLVAWITISILSVRAAKANPTEVLRAE